MLMYAWCVLSDVPPWSASNIAGEADAKMDGMTGRATHLLRDVLELPTDERAAVVTELLASLDDAEPAVSADMEAAWAEELERRARRVLSGESAGTPWEEVRRSIEANLPRR